MGRAERALGSVAAWRVLRDIARARDTPASLRTAAIRRINGECATLGSVAVRTCTVSFTGQSGIRHSVDVTAESVYEAAAFGVSALRKSGWADVVAVGTELEVQVRVPPTCHRITVQQIHRWCEGMAVSPDATLKKRKLKQLLG